MWLPQSVFYLFVCVFLCKVTFTALFDWLQGILCAHMLTCFHEVCAHMIEVCSLSQYSHVHMYCKCVLCVGVVRFSVFVCAFICGSPVAEQNAVTMSQWWWRGSTAISAMQQHQCRWTDRQTATVTRMGHVFWNLLITLQAGNLTAVLTFHPFSTHCNWIIISPFLSLSVVTYSRLRPASVWV